MVNTKKLREYIKERGIKLNWLAGQLNLSPYGFTLKIENRNDFRLSEVAQLCKVLKIDDLKLKEELFFYSEDEKRWL